MANLIMYLRLSIEDDVNADESNSITNQRRMLMVNKEAQHKQNKDSQPRRYSAQLRVHSKTGNDSQRSR